MSLHERRSAHRIRPAIRRSLPIAILSLALLPAGAGAASGSKSDRKGDAVSHGDLVRASATYEPRGSVRLKLVVASYADAAARRTVMGGFFARRGKKGGCDTSSGIAVSFESETKVAESGYAPGGGRPISPRPAKATVKGNTIRLDAFQPEFANHRFNCVVVVTLERGSTSKKSLDKITVRLKR